MRLLMIGGGGHCRSILDCVLRMGTYDDVGIVDFDSSASALGIPVVG
ncbi:MAG: serine acetyltransferase, partial [Parasporobacterium sp.]|nr:serine acetyltransferase [Parasporobacterium sp.]